MMTKFTWATRPILVSLALAIAAPAVAQSTVDKAVDARLRKVEAEVTALQRQVFPGGDGKYFAPQVQPGTTTATPLGTPASTPVTDILARMESLESQVQRLTAQQEENTNKMSKVEARLAALEMAAAPPPSGAPAQLAPSAAAPAAGLPAATMPSASLPAAALPAGTSLGAAPKPAATKPATTKPAANAPSAQRLAAVKKVKRPQTDDPADDEYSYGYRLWEAKFYPEAQQQLKLFLQKYPKHKRVSFARNLLGRAYLDEGNPREAASWFLQNYQADKRGERASDSLLFLAESMRQLKDTNRACVALAQFAEDYAKDAAGRLKTQYDAVRAGVKCN